MTHAELRKRLRRKSEWSVSDFADYSGLHHRTAKRMLVAFDREVGGILLRASKGNNRRFTFFWRALAKQCPDAFLDDPLDSIDRIDRIEEKLDVVETSLRHVASQTGQNTRDLVRMRPRRSAGA